MPLEQKIALCDVDDTWCATQRMFIQEVNNRNFALFQQGEMAAYTPYKYNTFTEQHLMARDNEWYEHVKTLVMDKDIIIKAQPFKKALAGVKLLHEAGYEIHTFSAREDPLHQTLNSWLEIHGFIPYISEIHSRYLPLNVEEFKLSIAHKIGPDVCFDDRRSTAQVLAENGYLTYLMRRPWNRELNKSENIIPKRSFYQAAEDFLKNTRSRISV
jgi:hypothetical protein